MNYFVHQHQEHDPLSQHQGSFDQSTNNYYSYSYSYPNPHFSTGIHPYSYQNHIVQPSQLEEQEPNPPGVTPPLPPPPPPELSRNSYYQFHAHGGAAGIPIFAPQPGAVDAGVRTLVHQPIVQPLYGDVDIMDGIVPRGDAYIHIGPKLNISSYPFRVNGHGGGCALPMNAATPLQDQTVIAHGGIHIQGGPSQLLSQSYGETHHGPRPNVSGCTYRARGRGKGCVQRKRETVPAVDKKLLTEDKSAELASVLPPPKVVSCELCKVECNTPEILQQHMNGKKHKKKLKVFEEIQNLNERVISGRTEQTSTTELKSEVLSQPEKVEAFGNQQLQPEVLPCQEINEESKVAGEKRKVEEVEPPEETAKKMRVDRPECAGHVLKRKLRGGKSNRKMRPCDRSKSLVQAAEPKQVVLLVCELCNVKCESLVVFQSHLVGKKHKSKAKRFLGQETFGPEMQTVDQNSADASTSIGYQHHDQGFGAYWVASAQNVKITSDQGSTLGDNMTTIGEVEAICQPESLVPKSGASFLVSDR